MPESIRDKYQYFTEANLGRLRAAGYSAPVTSLEDAVSDYVRNYLVPTSGSTRPWRKMFVAADVSPLTLDFSKVRADSRRLPLFGRISP